jgi:hypothetical protein
MTAKANYGGGNKGGSVLAGLKTRSPPVEDASRKIRGGHVDSGAVRSEPSKQPATIGPRCA